VEGEEESFAFGPLAVEAGPVLQPLGGVSLSCWTQDPFTDKLQRFALEVEGRRLARPSVGVGHPAGAAVSGGFDRRGQWGGVFAASGFLVDGAQSVVRSDGVFAAAERLALAEIHEERGGGLAFLGTGPSGHVGPLPAAPLLPAARIARARSAGAAHVRRRFVDGRGAAHLRALAFNVVKDFSRQEPGGIGFRRM